MYEVLYENEKSKAFRNLQQSNFNIKNNLLLIDNNKHLNNFALQDIGRLMMNSSTYCLTESINNVDELSNPSAAIVLSDIDNFIITMSLKAYTLSDEFKNKGDIAFFISPMIFSYSLLLSYHIIINHVASMLGGKEIVKFKHNQGILIVSDNKDILSHIWNLKVNEVSLKKFIPIYTLESGKFKKVALEKEKRNNNYEDGTLPWICIYKAFQNKLPETLEKIPQVIVLDLLPLKHRARASELIEWARKFAKHIIVIAPLYEDALYAEISKKINNKLALDYFNLLRLDELVEVKNTEDTWSLMRSWTLNSSLRYFTKKDNYEIIIINGLSIYEKMITDIYALFRHFNFEYKKNQISIELNWIFQALTNLIIPLEWYERAKQMQGEYSIKQQINACKQRLFLEDQNCQQILESLILQINRLYDVIYEAVIVPKGEAVLAALQKAIAEKAENILILVSDKVCCSELKIWIKFNLKLELKILNKIKVMYQKEWSNNQIKIFNDNNNEEFDIIIIANPLAKKYLSFLYFDSKANIKFISLTYEMKLIEYQIRKVTEINYTYMDDFKKIIYAFFNLEIMKSVSNENKSIPNCTFESSWVNNNISNYKNQLSPNLDLVFNNNVLLEMFINEKIEENITTDEDYEEIVDTFKSVSSSNEKIKCIKIEVTGVLDSAKWIYFIPIDRELKIKEKNTNEIKDRIVTEIRNSDIWIKLKKDKKSELFDEILKLSTDTLVMQFIKMNTNEWREMVRLLWHKFYNGEKYKNAVYEKILIEINKNGGSIKTSISISNWITGAVTLVKNKKNISAVAKILGEKEYLDKVNIIYKSMRELWSIHIRLGKEIVKIIDKYASKNYMNNSGEWVELGQDIIINTLDITKTIDVLEITQINLEAIFYADIDIVNRRLTHDETLLLNMKGAIEIE